MNLQPFHIKKNFTNNIEKNFFVVYVQYFLHYIGAWRIYTLSRTLF